MSNSVLNNAVRENRFLTPQEYRKPPSWLDRLGQADTNPLLSMGLSLLTTGQGNNPTASAFKAFTDAAANKRAEVEQDQQEADLINAEQAMATAPNYGAYQKALATYAALPGANTSLMALTQAQQQEKLTGIPALTGNVIDPYTGQTRYVDPVPFATQMDRKRQLADFEYEYQQRGLDADTARQRAQEQWLARNQLGTYAPSPTAGSGSMVLDPTTGEMVYEKGPTKGQQQAVAGVYAARMKGADKMYPAAMGAVPAAEQLVNLAGQLSDVPLANTVAGFAESTLGVGGDAGEAVVNLEQALTPLAIGMHTGGPMTNADFEAYRKAILDTNQSTASRVQAAKRAQAGAIGNLAYMDAQRAWYDQHQSLAGFDDTVGRQITEATRARMNGL